MNRLTTGLNVGVATWVTSARVMGVVALAGGLAALTGGCTEEKKRPLGATCDDNAQCESGLCLAGVCVEPSFPGDVEVVDASDALDGTVEDGDQGFDVVGPPVAVVIVSPEPIVNANVARFEFVSEPPGASFVCMLNGAEAVPCESPYEVTVGEGEHTLVIIARWPDGSEDPDPPVYTWRVDLTSPSTTITSGPGNWMPTAWATFEFSADEAADFACSVDEGAWAECTSPHTVSGLANGRHRFEVMATDAAGNAELEPADYEWGVDLTVPETVIDSGPNAVTGSNSATFAFSVALVVSPVTFECALDDAAFAACTSPWDVSGLRDGSHVVAVQARSSAGLFDPEPAEWRWVVDTIVPVVGVCGPAHEASTLDAPTAGLCNEGTATPVTGDGPFGWDCEGSGGGASAACSSDKSCPDETLTWGSCSAARSGQAHLFSGTLTNTTPSYTGSAASQCTQGTWNLSNETCTPIVAGVCGTAAGQSALTAPTTNLCSAGNASTVVTGPDNSFDWSCVGTNGGATVACGSNRSCPAQTLTWGSCSASRSSQAHLFSGPLTNTAVNHTGSVTSTCNQGTWNQSNETCTPIVAGVCGTAAGQSTVTAPTTNLCSAGNASSVVTGPDNSFDWSCVGTNGGATVACGSNRSCTAQSQSWAVGQSSCTGSTAATVHSQTSSASDTTQPTTGSRTYACSQGTWTGSGTGTCSTNGACGTANGGSTASAPTTGLCSAGTATTVSGAGPYVWSCNGFDGGTNASCSSNRSCSAQAQSWSINQSSCTGSTALTVHAQTNTVLDQTQPTTGSRTYTCSQGTWTGSGTGTCSTNGACGTANGGSTTSAPTTGFCNAGTATTVSGTGPYSWSCNGFDGGTNASCSSNRSCTAQAQSWTVNPNTCSGSTVLRSHTGTSRATDSTAPARGSRDYSCNQGVWSGSGTGSCITLDVTSPAEGAVISVNQVTMRFTVTGNPSTTECRLYPFGAPSLPAFTACTNPWTAPITNSCQTEWVLQLRVGDVFGNLWIVTRKFWNCNFG